MAMTADWWNASLLSFLSLSLFPSLVQTEYWISITTGEADIESFCSSTSFANRYDHGGSVPCWRIITSDNMCFFYIKYSRLNWEKLFVSMLLDNSSIVKSASIVTRSKKFWSLSNFLEFFRTLIWDLFDDKNLKNREKEFQKKLWKKELKKNYSIKFNLLTLLLKKHFRLIYYVSNSLVNPLITSRTR